MNNKVKEEQPLLENTDKNAILPMREALANVWKPARWIILNAVFHPVYSMINAILLGHQTNEKMLAGLGLGSLTIGIFALSIGSNFNQAIGTFISQAYGQKEYRQCQVYRNKGIFLASILYFIILVPLLFIRQIYTAIGQDDEMADYATQYVHYTIPFVYFFFISQIYQSFANNQLVTWYGLVSMIVGTIGHATMVSIFYFGLDMGFQGIVLATGLMFILRFLSNYALVTFRDDVKKHDDVYLFSKETVTNLSPLVKKCFASMSLGVWGWWSFEIFTLMATYISPAAAGAQTILRSIGLLTFMMPVGFANGAAILIGKCIGEEKKNQALQYYRVSQIMALVITAVQIVLLIVLRDQMISMFTSQEDIVTAIQSAWPVLCVFTLFDTSQCMGLGFVRGSGKQMSAAILTVTAYVIIGVPLAYYCGIHKDMGTLGLWIGPTAACAYLTLMYNILVMCLNWPKLFEEVRERRNTENEQRQRLLDEAAQDKTDKDDDFQRVKTEGNSVQ